MRPSLVLTVYQAFSIIQVLGALEAFCKYLLNKTNISSPCAKKPVYLQKMKAEFSGSTEKDVSLQKKSENCERR